VTDELKRPVVLAVDDSTDMLALIEKRSPWTTKCSPPRIPGSGIEKAFGEPRPDLILLDVDMPDVNGFEVCRALKDEALTASIPVIFLPRRPRPRPRSRRCSSARWISSTRPAPTPRC
jgi:CheY-like chemotaxis protein